MNISDKLINPRGQALKKWMMELLQGRYHKHEYLIERMSHQMVNNQELQDFTRFAVDLFEIGYLKCLNDYKSKLSDMGIKVNLIPEQPSQKN